MSPPFAERVLAWFEAHGRRGLPWQQEPTPYRIWVSEIMLQQTQVATVVPYFERFVARFPDVGSLASATLDEVLHHWSGLGYYARARHLHRAARLVCQRHDGRLPGDMDALRALPGIGRSTAGAILALAHGQRQPILDGNVKRVLARFHAVAGWPGSAAVLRELWALAERHTPTAQVAEYTQAMMDLGATVCTRGRPACDRCPLAEDCEARRLARQGDYPAPRPRKRLPVRETCMLLALNTNDEVLLERRPDTGVWGGLWGFPELESPAALEDWVQGRAGGCVTDIEVWPVFRHTFSHFHLDITPVVARVSPGTAVSEDTRHLWYPTRTPPRLGLSAPVQTLLTHLAKGTGHLFSSTRPSP